MSNERCISEFFIIKLRNVLTPCYITWFYLFTGRQARGCHSERGWNQQIMMLENGRFYHSMYLGIL